MSDLESPSSPISDHPREKSFISPMRDYDDSQVAEATPEPTERPRDRRRGTARDSTVANGAADGGSGSGGATGAASGATNGNNPSLIGKIRHLKKEDGEPLWRKDIQYDFLRAIFDNGQRVFTNSYEPDPNNLQTFADLYIDTMSRSSKTSRVLRDKLLSDHDAAKGMAMVCLLVNIGRMNTTLNFFPEMRAQLRTYHAIPSLQARQDPHAYKQLQDAPRLKSILKGGAEDRPEPATIDDIKATSVPRTNPVNLLFIICHSASRIADLHFPTGNEFHDLLMKTGYSSASRARAFLWLMWFYLESDFTEEGCEENPFGAGVDYEIGVANQGVPRLEPLTPEEEAAENVDPPEEIEFGYEKQKVRARIIEADQQHIAESSSKRGARTRMMPASVDEPGPTTGILPRIRPSKHDASDRDSIRSTPPPRGVNRPNGLLSASASRRPGGHALKYQIIEASSPVTASAGNGGAGAGDSSAVARKPRLPTAHQLAIERNRSERVEHILDKGLRKRHRESRKARRATGSIVRALHRLNELADFFEDSEGEETARFNRQLLLGVGNGGPHRDEYLGGYPFRGRGYAGLVPLVTEEDDFGEEVSSFEAALRRSHRRLLRWQNYQGPDLGVIPPRKRRRSAESEEDEGGEDSDGDGGDGDGDVDASADRIVAFDPPDSDDDEATELPVPQPSRNGSARAGGGGGRQSRGATKATNGRRSGAARLRKPSTAADDSDDVDKQLLELAGGDDADSDAAADQTMGADDEPSRAAGRDSEDELDDMDKTLLGMEENSDSE